MSAGHYSDAGAYVDHGDASHLLPVEELAAEVYQYRDAELVLDDADGDEVVVVSPTSLASSYYLTQHPLSAIEIDSLPQDICTALAERVDVDLADYELIQVGRQNSSFENRSLEEFRS